MENKNKLNLLLEMEYLPSTINNKVEITKYNKIPITELSSLGVGFSQLSESARTVTKTINMDGLYRAKLPVGATQLAVAKDGSGMLGTALDSGKHLVGQTRWEQVGNVTQTTVMPIDPTTLAMAVALSSINQKLDTIQETQKDILMYLQQKDRANLKGNLETLIIIFNEYKLKWNNENYCLVKQVVVEQIKNNTRGSINFYYDQINNKLSKQSFLQIDHSIKERIQKLISDFKDYQLAIYVLSFASFVEVLLSNDYTESSLSLKIKELENTSFKYRELYTKCYDMLEDNSKKSVESLLLNGITTITKTSGKLLSKVPLVNKSNVDESLIQTSEKLEQIEGERETKLLKELTYFNANESSIFIDNIKTIKEIYNNPFEMLIDSENIYIKTNTQGTLPLIS